MEEMESRDLPLVTVIVPVYNQEKYIAQCINSLLNQDYPPEKLEIIVVDNNSEDNTSQILKVYREKGVKILEESKRGPAATRNKGIKESKGEIIAFIDADCEASPSWLKCLIEGLRENKADAVAGISSFCGKKGYVAKVLEKRGFDSLMRNFSESHKWIGWAPTRNFAVKKEILKRLGGFCEEFTHPADEDIDLCLRMQKNGYRIRFVSEAKVFHHRADYLTLRKSIKKCFWEGFFHFLLLLKFPEKRRTSFFTPLLLFLFFLLILRAIFLIPFSPLSILSPFIFLIFYLLFNYLSSLPCIRKTPFYTLSSPATADPLEFFLSKILFFSQEMGFLFACFKYRKLDYFFFRFIPEEGFLTQGKSHRWQEAFSLLFSLFLTLYIRK